VFLYFDRDGNGFIDCTEFLVGLRGDLAPSRKKFVRMAFDILDTDKSGKWLLCLQLTPLLILAAER
jgi:Ca2+-binding EF-hand superfamily protein